MQKDLQVASQLYLEKNYAIQEDNRSLFEGDGHFKNRIGR